MAHALSWVVLALSGAALAYVLLQALRGDRSVSGRGRPFFLAAFGTLGAGALLTLPTGTPWSPGQTLPPGFLLGGASVLLAAFASGRLAGDPRRRFLAAAARCAAAALGIAVLLVLFPARLLDPAAGFALGALTAGLLVAGGLRLATGEQEWAAEVEDAAVFAVTLAAATFFAAYHRSPAGVREWQPLPALLGAALAVLFGLRAVLPARGAGDPGREGMLTAGVVLLPLAVLAALIGFQLHGTPSFFYLVLLGLVAFSVVGGLDRSAAPAEEGASRAGVAPLAPFLVIGAAVLAFRGLHGYGIALMLLAASALLALFPSEEGRPLLRRSLQFGLLLALYRLFEEKSGYVSTLEPDFFYYHVALVLGALLPLLFARGLPAARAEAADPAAKGGAAPALSAVGLAGAVAALAPLVLWVLLGARPQAALLVGVGIGAALLLALGPGAGIARTASLGNLLAMGALLAAAQFTFLVEPLAMWTRVQRIGLLAALGVAGLLWLGLTAALDRGGRANAGARVSGSDGSGGSGG